MSNPNPAKTPDEHRTENMPAGELTVIWVIWITYGAFYFCRTNIAAAVPGIQAEFRPTNPQIYTQIGFVLGALKLTYGLGQFVNGQLSELYSPRRLLAIGMFCSAALNVVFGFGTALYFLLFVWACNGYFQSFGWTPCMRVAANWIPPRRRGKAIGIIGTGYQLTAALTFIVSGLAVSWLGWRGALYVPAAILAAAAVFMLVFLRESPDDDRQQRTASELTQRKAPGESKLLENVVATLCNPALWLLGLSLGLLNACRYGFLDWGITHLVNIQAEVEGAEFEQSGQVLKSAVKYAILPLGGIVGSYVSGWATDRFFGSRRAPVICALLVMLGILTLIYDPMARASFAGTLMVLSFIGFCIYGPQVLLVGTAPADLARGGTAAAAAGFVNFMGYMGAFAGDQATGYMVDHYDWPAAVRVWATWAFAAAVAVALLWNANSRQRS